MLRPATMLTDRRGGVVRIRDDAGAWRTMHDAVRPYDSMLSEFADPQVAPDLLSLRERIRSWRFYDHVRTDARGTGSREPDRHAHAGARPRRGGPRRGAADDPRDRRRRRARHGDGPRVSRQPRRGDEPGRTVRPAPPSARAATALAINELSDGTLRYLLWTAALLTPRPPTLLVLNEPETSLHPELLAPLAELIVAASAHTQVIVVTHASALVQALRGGAASAAREVQVVELTKEFGQTTVVGQDRFHEQPWTWPAR